MTPSAISSSVARESAIAGSAPKPSPPAGPGRAVRARLRTATGLAAAWPASPSMASASAASAASTCSTGSTGAGLRPPVAARRLGVAGASGSSLSASSKRRCGSRPPRLAASRCSAWTRASSSARASSSSRRRMRWRTMARCLSSSRALGSRACSSRATSLVERTAIRSRLRRATGRRRPRPRASASLATLLRAIQPVRPFTRTLNQRFLRCRTWILSPGRTRATTRA